MVYMYVQHYTVVYTCKNNIIKQSEKNNIKIIITHCAVQRKLIIIYTTTIITNNNKI